MNLVFPDNFLLIISYDGSDYFGWAIQKDKITIQGVFKKCFDDLFGKYEWSVAGRTDRGVHAYGQILSISTVLKMPRNKLLYLINDHLPASIQVKKIKFTNKYIDIRRTAKKRTYKYFMDDISIFTPFKSRYRNYIDFTGIDWEIFKEEMESFIGRHNFFNFSSANTNVKNYERTVFNFDIRLSKKSALITISADGFLYNMVRRIIGSLLDLSRGKLNKTDYQELFNFGIDMRNKTSLVAPNGLYLWRVNY
jgi:tRNA pseudouridine38-40 synthase